MFPKRAVPMPMSPPVQNRLTQHAGPIALATLLWCSAGCQYQPRLAAAPCQSTRAVTVKNASGRPINVYLRTGSSTATFLGTAGPGRTDLDLPALEPDQWPNLLYHRSSDDRGDYAHLGGPGGSVQFAFICDDTSTLTERHR